MDPVSHVIGEHIRILREEKDMTQTDLAEKAELSLSAIGKLERGKSEAKISSLCRTIGALDMSYSEFFGLIDMEMKKSSEASPAIECYEWMQNKTTDQQERLFHILQEIDGYK